MRRLPQKIGNRTIDRLADRLAEHGSLPKAAVELRISYNHANVLFQKMQRDLGREQCR